MPFTTYGANKVLDHILKTASFTVPTNIYIGLLTNNGALTEVAGGSYARQLKNAWPASTGGAVSNDTLVTFPTATADWGTITGVAIYDAVSAGNCIAYGALGTSKPVPNGATAKFPIGDIDFTVPTT